MSDFSAARQSVADLVDRFRLNPPTNETSTRIAFINPLFEALGWDVANRAGHAEQYKDVVHEDSVLVGAATKAPDYSFRIGGLRKFFVEAKKPSVDLKGDPGPAYQLRRYAWSAKLPLSVLTDFQEFAVYDCTKRPSPTDPASKTRILYLTADQYADRFHDLWDLLAKDSVLKGSFDRFAQKARGTAEVNAEFLREIESWRDILAKNVARLNPKLDIDRLNIAVQRVIDRIIFLRMAEDRGIEPQGRLLALTNADRIYPRFAALCQQADAKYNSGLFDFAADTWTLSLDIDDKILRPILKGIYYPDSPYEFSVIPPEILGNVYEQFLGKVIRLTPGHQAKVEEKPEVKKAGGVYYTPKYIVDYIVQNTVGRLLNEYCVADRITGVSPVSSPDRITGILPVSDHGQDARDTNPALNIRHGAFLPHWELEGSTYFVTFRLADSLPQSVLIDWAAQRDAILKHAHETQDSLTPAAALQIRQLFSERVDRYLDAGHGASWLKDPRVAQLVQDALLHFDGQRYTLISWSIMPNHVHVVVRPHPPNDLPSILQAWKSFTSKQANRILHRTGQFWRVEYYDHLIRDERDFHACVDYTYRNPDLAGLSDRPWRGIHSDPNRITGVPPVSEPDRITSILPVSSGADSRITGVPPVSGPQPPHGQDARDTKYKNTRSPIPPDFHVLDPACGSGSFLLGAYQCLLDHCLQWYVAHNPEKHPKAVYRLAAPRGTGVSPVPPPQWRLTTHERKRILTAHIFGVDIDPQAVEVTKLSLLLKVLEGESADSLGRQFQLFRERALPNLDQNIRCGNSLIGPDYFAGHLPGTIDNDELRRVNPFDWEAEFPSILANKLPAARRGFDCVIGNPPYVRQESLSQQKEYLQNRYESFDGVADLYAYFMEKGVRLLRDGGLFSIIVSSSFLRATYGEPLRRFLKKSASIIRIVDFGGRSVFENAKDTYVCIPLLSKRGRQDRVEVCRVQSLGVQELNAYVTENHYTIPHDRLSTDAWSLKSDNEAAVFAKLMKAGKPLGEYVERRFFRGVTTGLNEAFVIDTETKKRLIAKDKRSAELIHPLLGGEDVRRYIFHETGLWMIFTRRGVDIRKYPVIRDHLQQWKEDLTPKRDKKARRGRKPGSYQWYEIQDDVAYYQVFDGPKLIFPDIAKGPRFSLDNGGHYLTNTAYCLGTDDLYLLGILNSRLFWFAISHISIPFGIRAGQYRYRLIYQYMEKVPIHPVDLSDPADKSRHDRMVTLVTQMLDLHQTLHAAKTNRDRELLQRQIDSTNRQIDQLVYELYGLADKEIQILEGEDASEDGN